VSPPLTLLPARPVPVDVSGNVASQQHRPIETVGAAIADDFERRWQASDEMPLMLMLHRDPLEGLIGGISRFQQDSITNDRRNAGRLATGWGGNQLILLINHCLEGYSANQPTEDQSCRSTRLIPRGRYPLDGALEAAVA
jgi:hypothetical protein